MRCGVEGAWRRRAQSRTMRSAPPRARPAIAACSSSGARDMSGGWSGDGKWVYLLILLLRLSVSHDEKLLARLEQTELAACELLDRRRILAEPPRLFAEQGVLAPRALQRLLDRGVFAARFQQRHQTFLADDGVDDEDN